MKFRVQFKKYITIDYDGYKYTNEMTATFESAVRCCAADIGSDTYRTTDQVLQDMLDYPHKYRIQFEGYIEKVL